MKKSIKWDIIFYYAGIYPKYRAKKGNFDHSKGKFSQFHAVSSRCVLG